MSVVSQSIAKAENRFAPLAICGVVSILLFAGLLRALGVSLVVPALVFGVAALVWIALRYTIPALGVVLALMSIFPLAFILAKFFGPPYIASLEGCDRVALLVIACILWKRNGVKLVAADWFLLAAFALALIRLSFGGELINLLADFGFIIAYAAGRVTPLSVERQRLWAERAVWIVAVLSILGMVEIFVLGQGPRAILYSTSETAFASNGALSESFAADSSIFRETSTMISPPFFALLCMVALIIWWVYLRSTWPALIIGAGMICAVTRSAWIGTALAITLLAFRMKQKKRLIPYASLAIALFVASIPFLGMTDYLTKTKSNDEASAQYHQVTLNEGLQYVIEHPLGSGPGNYEHPLNSKHSVVSTTGAPWIESTYLKIAAEYGVVVGVCFAGLVIFAGRAIWVQWTHLGHTAIGILIGFGLAMIVAPLNAEFALASWIWFPVGLAVRSATNSSLPPKGSIPNVLTSAGQTAGG